MRSFFRGGMLAAAAAALAGLGAFDAPAARAEKSEYSVGRGIVCDTSEQIEAIVTPGKQDVGARMDAVNARYGAQACTVVTALFLREDEQKRVLVPDGIVRIVKVKVVGIRNGAAWVGVSEPMEQYVGIHEEAMSA